MIAMPMMISMGSSVQVLGRMSASDLMAKYPNLCLASLGVLLMGELSMQKMDAEYNAIELMRTTSKEMRGTVLDSNESIRKTIPEISENETNKKAGIATHGGIEDDNQTTWERIKHFFITAALWIAAFVCMFIPGLQVLGSLLIVGLILAIVFGSQLIQPLVNTGVLDEQSKLVEDLNEIISMLNPIYFVVYGIITIIIESLEATGTISKEQAEKGRAIGKMVASILTAVIIIIASIAATILSGGAASAAGLGASMQAVAQVISAVSGIISGVLAITNGSFSVIKGLKALEVAQKTYSLRLMQAALDAIRKGLEALSSLIDTMIQDITDNYRAFTTEWSSAENIAKREADTQTEIARNITI
jgi:hypothetical protein